MELRLVEARPVAEDAGMLAEALAVVRGDDHPGPLEDAAALELVDQPAQLLIEVRDAVVVGVADEARSAAAESPRLVQRPPVLDQVDSRWSRGLTPKRWMPVSGS